MLLLSAAAFLLLASAASALPQQLTFEANEESASPLPPLDPAHFPGHTLLPLSDGTFLPSPGYGVGSRWFGQGGDQTVEAVLSAFKVGYRHIDNSAIYRTEGAVGEALAKSGLTREEVYITTKYDNIGGESVEVEFEKSLKNLGVDYIDLYLIHFPAAAPNLTKTWASFEGLQKAGKIRSLGLSNYDSPLLSSLLSSSSLEIPPVVNQIRYHPYNTIENAPLLQLGREKGVRLQAYSALSSLTKDEWKNGPVDAVVNEIAESKGWTDAQVILSWVKQRGVAVVTTSSKPTRQEEQLEVFDEAFGELSLEELEAIDAAGRKGEQDKVEQ